LATYVLLIAGVWRWRWDLLRPPLLWGILLVVAFMGVHTFYWTNLRMRAPLIPVLSLLAAAGAEPLAAKLASRFRAIRRPKA
jgi:hypothetical protein